MLLMIDNMLITRPLAKAKNFVGMVILNVIILYIIVYNLLHNVNTNVLWICSPINLQYNLDIESTLKFAMLVLHCLAPLWPPPSLVCVVFLLNI